MAGIGVLWRVLLGTLSQLVVLVWEQSQAPRRATSHDLPATFQPNGHGSIPKGFSSSAVRPAVGAVFALCCRIESLHHLPAY